MKLTSAQVERTLSQLAEGQAIPDTTETAARPAIIRFAL
jgi:hypothetical protein